MWGRPPPRKARSFATLSSGRSPPRNAPALNSPWLQKCARLAHMAVPECSLNDTFSSALEQRPSSLPTRRVMRKHACMFPYPSRRGSALAQTRFKRLNLVVLASGIFLVVLNVLLGHNNSQWHSPRNTDPFVFCLKFYS